MGNEAGNKKSASGNFVLLILSFAFFLRDRREHSLVLLTLSRISLRHHPPINHRPRWLCAFRSPPSRDEQRDGAAASEGEDPARPPRKRAGCFGSVAVAVLRRGRQRHRHRQRPRRQQQPLALSPSRQLQQQQQKQQVILLRLATTHLDAKRRIDPKTQTQRPSRSSILRRSRRFQPQLLSATPTTPTRPSPPLRSPPTTKSGRSSRRRRGVLWNPKPCAR